MESFSLFSIVIFLSVLLSVSAQHNEVVYSTPQKFAEHSQQEEVVMSLIVEAGRIECLYQPVTNQHTAFEMDYQVVEGGDNDITFMIKSPQGVVLVNEQKSMEGSHKIAIDEPHHGRGDYAICFDNSFSLTTKKRVFFELFLLDKEGNYMNDYDLKALAHEQKYGMSMQIHTFNRITNKLKNDLNEIERMQSQIRAVEARDRSTMETNYNMVNWMGAINMLSLVLAASVQVLTIRCLFTEDSKFGNFVRHGKFSR